MIEDKLRSLIDNGWEYSIRAEIDKPLSIVIWRAEWVTYNPYTLRNCHAFFGEDLTLIVDKAYEYTLGVI